MATQQVTSSSRIPLPPVTGKYSVAQTTNSYTTPERRFVSSPPPLNRSISLTTGDPPASPDHRQTQSH